MPNLRDDLLVWIDLEMTGLDCGKDVIVEIATLITDNSLEIVAEGPAYAISRPSEVLDAMQPVVKEMHAKNGLTERCRASTIGPAQAEFETLRFVQGFCKERTAPLCGNSVWMDRLFLNRQMGTLDRYLHHRCVDVSTLKELARRWRPEIASSAPQKPETHRALDDIRASLTELKHYRAKFLQLR
ncbi:MAG: oligoribonuclease [Planctomycetes bacterium]|nr:oligoribonuclease [Planctomycetota bacterium]